MIRKLSPYLLIIFVVIAFFWPFILQNKYPIPSDTIVGLYHPFRDFYSKDYPNGIPYKNFLITDPVRQQYPWKLLAAEAMKEMKLPLWNRYNFAGTPLFANFQSAALYPLNILLLILPFNLGWGIIILLQPLMAAMFMYLYLRNLKQDIVSCLFGSMTFAFSGFMTVWMEWGTIGHTALWLPLILLAMDKIFDSFSNSGSSKFKIQNYSVWGFTFVASLASSFFGGHLQTFFYLSLLSVCYFFLRWFQYGKSKKAFIIFLILSSLFLILTSVQWLPTLNFISESARGIDQNWLKEGWFIPWQHLVQFVAPDFFGNPATLNYWGVWNYAEFVGYIGIFPLLLAIHAIIYGKSIEKIFFVTVLLLSLLFSLPTLVAKLPYVLNIPLISTAQPTRLLFLINFSLSVLAAFGINILIQGNNKARILYPIGIIASTYCILWYFVFFGEELLPVINSDNLLVAERNLYVPSLLFLLTTIFVGFTLFVKNKKLKTVVISMLIIITIFDLFRFFHKFTPFTEKSYLFPTTKSIKFLQNQSGEFRIMTTDDMILPPNFSSVYKLQTLDGYDPLYLLRYGEFMAAMKRDRPDASPPFGFNRIITQNNINSRFVDLLGVKYVLSLNEVNPQKYELVFTEGRTKVYKNNQAYDRAFFVKHVSPVGNKNEAINKMFDINILFNESAVVQNFEGVTTSFAKGQVNNVKYVRGRVEIDVESKEESFLVLMDTYYPTWGATICPKDSDKCNNAKIYLTNYSFRGVIVPKGEHTVIFEMKFL